MAAERDTQSNRPLNDLVVDARNGNPAAVGELCNRYQQRLLTVAGNAGADQPETVVERALTQAMLAVGPDGTSDTMRFEQDVFARVLAAVVPAEQTHAPYGEDPAEAITGDDPEWADKTGHDESEIRAPESESESETGPTPFQRHGVRLLPPDADSEHRRPLSSIDHPEIDPRPRSWRPVILSLVGFVALTATAVATGFFLLARSDGPTTADAPTPTGALADGLRIAGRTATDATEPTSTGDGPASRSSAAGAAVTPTDAETTIGASRGASLTSANPTPTAPANATTGAPIPPTTSNPAPGVATANQRAAAPIGDYQNQKLVSVDFADQDLRLVDFSGATLRNVSFAQADLRGASFAGAVLDGADFAGADISGADFTGVTVVKGTINGFWREADPPIDLP